MESEYGLEHKFQKFGGGIRIRDKSVIEGYASLFGEPDQSGDIVQKGAYSETIRKICAAEDRVKMLWQHDPLQPIGVWDEVREDGRGLWVKGRLLDCTQRGREAAALIEAGAIDGLSIGYRTIRSTKDDRGQRRLTELELWEVSLVTFPMLSSARVACKGEDPAADDSLRELAAAFEAARLELAGR